MSDVQEKLSELRGKGWTVAAIADELGVRATTVHRWVSGDRYPDNSKPVLIVMDGLLQRNRIPKQRRYAPGSRKRTQSGADSE